MNFEKALTILEINISQQINNTEFLIPTKSLIKKQYKKLALIHHPDKNHDKNVDYNEKFQLINESYHYLLDNELYHDDDDDENKTKTSNNIYFEEETNLSYKSVLRNFIHSISQTIFNTDDSVFLDEIISIITNGSKEIIMKIFERMEEDVCMKIYSFLYQNRKILHIQNELFSIIQSIIEMKRSQQTQTQPLVFILNPTIDDLFENKLYVYKFFLDEKENQNPKETNNKKNVFYIPLWINETCFDNPNSKTEEDKELTFISIPELDDWVDIDENNDICVNINISISSLFLLLNQTIPVVLGKRTLYIPVKELRCVNTQSYIFKGMGISRHNEENIYDDSVKGDISVNISLY